MKHELVRRYGKKYEIRMLNGNGDWLYVKKVRRKSPRYEYTADYTYSRLFTEGAAKKHLKILNGG